MSEMESMQSGAVGSEDWCRRMEALLEQQVKYAKRQYLLTCVSGVIRLLILAAIIAGVIICVPKVAEVADQVQGALSQVQGVMDSMEEMTNSLKTISTQNSSPQSLSVDISKFNDAVSELHKAIESIPNIFGK